MSYRYFNCCVSWNSEDVHVPGGLCDLIDQARDITRRTFLRHVDRNDLKQLESQLCYADHPSQGLTMAGDWHVQYQRSKLHGRTVYLFVHSAIEYVFTKGLPDEQ